MFNLTGNTIVTCNTQNKPVQNIVKVLQRDIKAGFIYPSDYIKTSIALNIDKTAKLNNEQFIIDFPNNNLLSITAKDELGVIYGTLYISEKYIGIHPFDFWNDKIVSKMDAVKIPVDKYISEEFKVKFRGWFVNDEVLLNEWKLNNSSEEVWRVLFETLLRCKGNMVIPGTDSNSRKNRDLASDMGLWITHHHAEPLGAEMFSRIHPNLTASYTQYPELFEQIWEDGIIEQKSLKIIWNLGFRGQGDRAFWKDDKQINTEEDKGRLISKVMEKQRELVSKHIENPVFCTNLYGEILELYKDGYIKIPEDVIKIWGDSGYGKMVSRRQENHNPRLSALAEKDDTGLNGIYYHASFYDLQASNHITMIPNSPEFISNELTECITRGMNDYWIVNCGNVKPHAYILDLIKEFWLTGKMNIQEHIDSYLSRYFSKPYLVQIKGMYLDYFKNTIQYGPNIDERAGEQFYHHPARSIISEWMKGKQPIESLFWATGEIEFKEQVNWFKAKCQSRLEAWEKLVLNCREINKILPIEEARRFNGMFFVQVLIHYWGCKGFITLCESFNLFQKELYVEAFVKASDSLHEYEQSYKALIDAEYDKWRGYYRNDCLTDIQLTVYCCDNLRRYIRMLGESPNFHRWERDYLFNKRDKNIVLLTNTKKSLTDDELYRSLALELERRK